MRVQRGILVVVAFGLPIVVNAACKGSDSSQRQAEIVKCMTRDKWQEQMNLEAAVFAQCASVQEWVQMLIGGKSGDDMEAWRRLMASEALGALRGPETEKAVPKIIKAFKEGPPLVRMASAKALGRVRSNQAVPVLIDALSNPDPTVRMEAAWSLSLIGTREAAAAIPKLEELSRSGKDAHSVVAALHKLRGDPLPPDEAVYYAREK